MNHFPTYQPSEERIAEVAKQYAEENNPLNLHYDASREVRAKGAGFYQFSGDEETRKAQMAELKASREETTKTRQELGAEDIMPGQEEGMTADGVESRAMEKRKREVEDRRQMVESKRRKLREAREARRSSRPRLPDSACPPDLIRARSVSSRVSSQSGKKLLETSIDPFSVLETQVSTVVASKASTAPPDPFAALEARKSPSSVVKDIGKKKAPPATSETDTFLPELETQFLGSKTSK